MKLIFVISSLLLPVLVSSSMAAQDSPSQRDHWAFQAITRPEVPTVRNQAWVQTPIDAFILAKLEAAGLAPAPPAEPRTLLRRLSYNLTGLPSGFEEARSLDPQEAIEILLASPHFGERWARHWLDVARYSDTKGYAYSPEEFTFVHAWLYRDWVVRAFNDDLPFDQFLVRQLAADRLLETGRCEQSDLAAMGFFTLGPRFIGVKQDIIDDRIDTVTRGMLGLTVSCSRCHDHKYDPIPTSDYYALYGVFKSSHERMVALKESDDAVLKKLQKALAAEFETHAAAVAKRHLERAGDYLAATLDMSKVPAPDFTELFTKEDLNPEQIRRWHEYLSLADKTAHPIFGLWKALVESSEVNFSDKVRVAREMTRNIDPIVISTVCATPLRSMEELATRYGKLLNDHSDHPEIAKIIGGPDSPIAIPRERHLHEIEWLFAIDERNSMKQKLAEIERRIYELGSAAPHAIAMADQTVPENTRILVRGVYATPGEEVPRRAPSILGGAPFHDGSGRLELAKIIVNKDNPLTARVIVNRLWHHYFGTGLVNTPSDFGLRCEVPSHPELLDFLASQLIENKWSLKSIHRLITQSAVYQQSSSPATSVAATIDPENRLLSYFPRRPLDFEAMRDSLLFASGELDLSIGGKPGPLLGASASLRRSLYGRIDRQFLPNTLRDFDFANPELHSPQRHLTNVPQQALFFLNSPFVEARAMAFARRVGEGSINERAIRFFQIAFQRNPSAGELESCREFIEEALEKDREMEAKGSASTAPEISPWSYGYGHVDESSGKVENFVPLPYFTGEAWGGGENWPNAELGWVRLTATGGHVGNDLQHAAIRRWTSPVDGKVAISGTIQNDDAGGDGVRAVVTSPRQERLQSWTVRFGETIEVGLEEIEVSKGDTLDFVVDCGPAGNFSFDQFVWAPIVKFADGKRWDAREQFGGEPTQPAHQLDAWERFAHSLLLTNAFMFVD
ncbi:DUF1549 and DUF1553 domain-containing protein [Verrucomicrobiaceae bacterium 227]